VGLRGRRRFRAEVQPYNRPGARAWCSGSTRAFQALGAGSNPVVRLPDLAPNDTARAAALSADEPTASAFLGSTTADPEGDCDLVVVGAGILGLAVAREVTRRDPRLRVTVLEKEPEVGFHQTGHNSGVIHAGIYYTPGSLKARLCVAGAHELYEYCQQRGIEARQCGKVIVATGEQELPRLDELERRGQANGVPGLHRLTSSELAEIEPHCRGVAALHSPSTGIVDFRAVARAFADDVRDAGGLIATGCAVSATRPVPGAIRIVHARGETSARYAVFCAGAWADRLAVAAGAPADPRIVPFRGGYFRLRPQRRYLVRSLIYPVPDPELPFLGAHLTRHIDGEVLLGPTALIAGARDAYKLTRLVGRDVLGTLTWPGTWRMAARWWRTGVTELWMSVARRSLAKELARFVPEITASDIVPGPAGVRAQALARDGRLVDDFVLSATERALHVRNAPSPAATSSLAIARLIVDQAGDDLFGAAAGSQTAKR
jgi:L-2-hydroxyglutarate oxidase